MNIQDSIILLKLIFPEWASRGGLGPEEGAEQGEGGVGEGEAGVRLCRAEGTIHT